MSAHAPHNPWRDDEAGDLLDEINGVNHADDLTGVHITPRDIAAGRASAFLCYALFFAPYWAVVLVRRRNAFAIYHARQMAILVCFTAALAAASIMMIPLCMGCALLPFTFVLWLALEVAGMLTAITGSVRPLPLIGTQGLRVFAIFERGRRA